MQAQTNAQASTLERSTLTGTYTVERYDRGPEPDWHNDRSLYGPWCSVGLLARDSSGAVVAVVHGMNDREAWYRLASEAHR